MASFRCKCFIGLLLLLPVMVTSQTMLFNSSSDVFELNFDTSPPTLQAQGNSQIPVVDENYECIGRAIDCEGQTLFTFVNHGVYNQFNTLIPGSNSGFIDLSSAEVAIIPNPANVNQYYIFYSSGEGCSNILYMIIDISMNAGLGGVVAVDQMLDNGFCLEGMESIRIPNTNNYRLMLYEYDAGLKSYLIEDTGISGGGIIYNFSPAWDFPFGFSCNSELDYHNGKLGHTFGWSRVISLMDYDPVTNTVSNAIVLNDQIFNPEESPFLNRGSAYGIEFSPDASKAYITNRWSADVIQYNFLTTNLTLIPIPITTTESSSGISQIELGPDGKLYISGKNESAIHVLDNPNDDIVTTSMIPVVGFTLDEGIEDPPAVHPLLNMGIVDFGNDTIVCEDFLVLDADNIGATYLWQDGSTDQTYTATESGIYSVEVSIGSCVLNGDIDFVFSEQEVELGADTLLCNIDLILDAGDSGIDYQWQDNSSGQTFQVNEVGTYWVIVTNSDGCIDSDSITIMQNGVALDLGDDIEDCNLNMVLDAGSNGTTYLWQDGSSTETLIVNAPGVYWVEATNEQGCINRDSITLTLGVIDIDLGEDFLTCIGNVEVLQVDDVYESYLWSTGENSSSIEVINDAQYWVFVTTGLCSASDTILVDFYLPEAEFEANIPNGCPEFSVFFNDLSSSSHGGITNWYWDFGDGGSSILNNPSNLYENSGEFEVSLTIMDEHNCDDSALLDYLIEVYTEPEALFSFTPDNPSIDNPEVQFVDESEDAVTWEWDFGDGSSSNNQDPLHVYNEPGSYQIILEVTNESGCTSSTAGSVFVEVPLSVYVPNSFTPNEDGVNDFFFPVITGLDPNGYSFTIYSRWGTIVFQSYDHTEKWNGSNSLMNQKEESSYYVSDGVYTWVLMVKSLYKADKEMFKGDVLIMR